MTAFNFYQGVDTNSSPSSIKGLKVTKQTNSQHTREQFHKQPKNLKVHEVSNPTQHITQLGLLFYLTGYSRDFYYSFVFPEHK